MLLASHVVFQAGSFLTLKLQWFGSPGRQLLLWWWCFLVCQDVSHQTVFKHIMATKYVQSSRPRPIVSNFISMPSSSHIFSSILFSSLLAPTPSPSPPPSLRLSGGQATWDDRPQYWSTFCEYRRRFQSTVVAFCHSMCWRLPTNIKDGHWRTCCRK